MATVPGLKKVGPFWHYSLQVNGQRAHGSTKATDLTTARRVMEEKRRALLHDQLHLTKRVPPTVNQVWDAWLKANESAFSQKHFVSVECRYRRWIKPDIGAVRVDRLKADLVLGIRTRQLEAGLSGRYGLGKQWYGLIKPHPTSWRGSLIRCRSPRLPELATGAGNRSW